jgi:hexulose-6-phosphate isomerase
MGRAVSAVSRVDSCVERPLIGIYEKALPKGVGWPDRLRMAGKAGYDFVEISVDESDERLARLSWTRQHRRELLAAIDETGVAVPSMCLSGHRRFSLGSEDEAQRRHALQISRQAIELAADVGVRVVQLAGYDVYYEPSTDTTRQRFMDGLRATVRWAERRQVMVAMEIMDYPLMSSITKYLAYSRAIDSPWFKLYPDLGNLSAWGNDVPLELERGINEIVGIHVKETLPVTDASPGQFRDVPFGEGCVDFVAAFSKLAQLSYCGPFLIEMWTEKANDPMAEVEAARRWVAARMRQGGYAL